MDQPVIPPPGTPAAELARLNEEERQLSERELDMLAQGAAVESRAREVQGQLDQARLALQRLAGTSSRAEAEKAFDQSIGLAIPSHVASAETSRALDLRRKALIARLQALEAEGNVVRVRAGQLSTISEAIARLKMHAAVLEQRAARQPAPAPIPLTPAPIPLTPAPMPLATPIDKRATAKVPVQPQAVAPVPPSTLTDKRATVKVPPQPAARPPLPEALRTTAPMNTARPQAKPAVPVAVPATPAPSVAPARPPGVPYKETRAAQRQKVQAEVSLSSESNLYMGFSGDLSEGGVFIATYEKLLSPGTQVEIALALPGRPPVKIPGTVRWVRELNDQGSGIFPGMGIAFENVSPEASAIVKAFLQKREPMFWDES